MGKRKGRLGFKPQAICERIRLTGVSDDRGRGRQHLRQGKTVVQQLKPRRTQRRTQKIHMRGKKEEMRRK